MRPDSVQEAGPAFKVVLANDRLSGTSLALTVELSAGIFSDLDGQEQVNSLVLEVQDLRFVNLRLYSTTYTRRSKVTESS